MKKGILILSVFLIALFLFFIGDSKVKRTRPNPLQEFYKYRIEAIEITNLSSQETIMIVDNSKVDQFASILFQSKKDLRPFDFKLQTINTYNLKVYMEKERSICFQLLESSKKPTVWMSFYSGCNIGAHLGLCTSKSDVLNFVKANFEKK